MNSNDSVLEIETKEEYSIIKIPMSKEKGFAFDVEIYVPENVRRDANLLLSFSDNTIDDPRFETLVKNMGVPVMVTKVRDDVDQDGNLVNNYKQFDIGALLDENGNIKGYNGLSLSLPEQYKRAIGEAYRVLKERQVISSEKKEKVDIEGYSYQGVRAQRLAMLIPESVRSVFVGGAISSIPLPVVELDGRKLEYPTGFDGVEKILGTNLVEEVIQRYKDVMQIIYATEHELKYDGNYSRDGIRVRDENGIRTDYSRITVSQHDISPDVVPTVKAQIEMFGEDINDRIAKSREVLETEGCALKKIKIYSGTDHHFSDPSTRLEPMNDLRAALASMDNLERSGELNPHESEILGFSSGADKIDITFEEKRTQVQQRLIRSTSTEEFLESCIVEAEALLEDEEESKKFLFAGKPFLKDISADVIQKAKDRKRVSMRKLNNEALVSNIRNEEIDELAEYEASLIEEEKTKDKKEGEEFGQN